MAGDPLQADTSSVTSAGVKPIRLVIADERRLIADALAALITSHGGFTVAAAVSAKDAVATIAARSPDVLVLGVSSRRGDATDLVRTIRARHPDLEIVILADVLRPELISVVLSYAVGGVLLTDSAAEEIAVCIEQVAAGHAVLPSGWKRALAAERADPVDALSQRQKEVLQLLAEGCSYEEIGTRLFISLNTVKFHVHCIFERLGVRNRMAAARLLGTHQ